MKIYNGCCHTKKKGIYMPNEIGKDRYYCHVHLTHYLLYIVGV